MNKKYTLIFIIIVVAIFICILIIRNTMKNLDKTSLDIIPTSKQFRGTVNSSKKSDSNKYDVFKPNKKVSESQFQESEDKIDYEISHKGEALLM